MVPSWAPLSTTPSLHDPIPSQPLPLHPPSPNHLHTPYVTVFNNHKKSLKNHPTVSGSTNDLAHSAPGSPGGSFRRKPGRGRLG